MPDSETQPPFTPPAPGPSPGLPDISVVVLSYRRPGLLRAALASVCAQTLPAREVLVVDNASDRSAEIREVCAEFPAVRLFANPENTGFTGGMNLGLGLVSGSQVLLTEDDIVLDAGCLLQLHGESVRMTRPGLITALILDLADGRICCAGGRIHLGWNFRLEIPERGAPADQAGRLPVDTGYASGAFVFARTSYLRWLGGFRGEFFMYQEDVELCLRVLRLGHAIRLVPAAVAFHHPPSSGGGSPLVEFHKRKNLLVLYCLQAPLPLAALVYIRYGWIDYFRAFRLGRADREIRARALWWFHRNLLKLFRLRRSGSPQSSPPGHSPAG